MADKIALKVYFDEETGEIAKVDCTKRFAEEGALFRIDVLKDAIEALENIYQYERSQFFLEYDEIGEA